MEIIWGTIIQRAVVQGLFSLGAIIFLGQLSRGELSGGQSSKNYFYQSAAKYVPYRNQKKLGVHSFLQDVEQLPEKISYTEQEKDFVKTLNKYAPLKTKMTRGNHKSFITKNLRKTTTIMFEKRENISNNPAIIKLYKKQRN